MKKKKEPEKYVPPILYVHVEEDDELLTAGDWFFNTASDCQCAQAAQMEDGRWNLYIDPSMSIKPRQSEPIVLDSIDACKAFLSECFERPVVGESQEEFRAIAKRNMGIDQEEDDEE